LSDESSTRLEAVVGHPGEKFERLLDRVRSQGIRQFENVQEEWLDLMWTLDAFRVEGVAPRGMGKETGDPAQRLAAVYRGKGDWFAKLLSALLENHTTQTIKPQIDVKGFSQMHQIDLAWPAREDDPLICAETKVTGAPAYGKVPERGAFADFSNRRKELKFAATDLKLYRRDQKTAIKHWGAWRETATPKAYFMWAARLRRGKQRILKDGRVKTSGRDDVQKLVNESALLVNTYLDGAGVFAWQVNDARDGYEAVPLSHTAQVSKLDDVLHKIASQIDVMAPQGEPPPPIGPERRAVSEEDLPEDDAKRQE